MVVIFRGNIINLLLLIISNGGLFEIKSRTAEDSSSHPGFAKQSVARPILGTHQNTQFAIVTFSFGNIDALTHTNNTFYCSWVQMETCLV